MWWDWSGQWPRETSCVGTVNTPSYDLLLRACSIMDTCLVCTYKFSVRNRMTRLLGAPGLWNVYKLYNNVCDSIMIPRHALIPLVPSIQAPGALLIFSIQCVFWSAYRYSLANTRKICKRSHFRRMWKASSYPNTSRCPCMSVGKLLTAANIVSAFATSRPFWLQHMQRWLGSTNSRKLSPTEKTRLHTTSIDDAS